MTPGPRQTVDRACHPTLGEGRLVYDNGPVFFLPDVGDPLPLSRAGMGGTGGGRSFSVGFDTAGARIEFDTTGRQGGERHVRMWSPVFGPGWLVSEPWPEYPGKDATPAAKARYNGACRWHRFEPDSDPVPHRWQWDEMHVGRLKKKGQREPPYPKKGSKPSPARVEWDRWRTIGGLEFRDAPPDEPAANKAQQTIGGIEG